ncbi:hypothetical protein ACIBO1_19970 [Micromonospora sp. NPDC049903]|uniref:hypothetical protein n=1 Tax=Micromonospora sp. NPDC049903 TaxID=3364276 RepID=UPI0037935959
MSCDLTYRLVLVPAVVPPPLRPVLPAVLRWHSTVVGGVRERLRAAGAVDLIPGVRLAATLASTTATALAGIWTTAETIAGQLPCDQRPT